MNKKNIKFYDSITELPKKEMLDIICMEEKEYDSFTEEQKDEEIEKTIEHYLSTNPDYIYNENWEVENTFIYLRNDKDLSCVCIDNEWFTENSKKVITKYFNNEDENEKWEAKDWNWDTIKAKKEKGVYTIAERGWVWPAYSWWFYNI